MLIYAGAKLTDLKSLPIHRDSIERSCLKHALKLAIKVHLI